MENQQFSLTIIVSAEVGTSSVSSIATVKESVVLLEILSNLQEMLKGLCVSLTLSFLVYLRAQHFLLFVFLVLTVGCDAFRRMQATGPASFHRPSLWSGPCLEGQRLDHRSLLSNFVIQHH